MPNRTDDIKEFSDALKERKLSGGDKKYRCRNCKNEFVPTAHHWMINKLCDDCWMKSMKK